MLIASVVAEVCRETGTSLETLLQWSSASDGAIRLEKSQSRALGILRERLECAGLLESRVRAVMCEDHWFRDLNTGEMVRTKRGKR